jgi:trimeric autotransporter adhesin
VPTTAKGASISIFDLNGQLLKSFNMPTTGFNQITITGGTLSAGDYLYTLFVDGQKIDTKKMTLTH